MIAGLICVVLFAGVVIPAASNGEWLVIAVAVVAGLFAILMSTSGKKVNKAYGNFVDYWADGGQEGRNKR